jgi:hypothetical protein
MRAVFAAVVLLATAASFAQDHTWAIYAGPSNSVPFLGGEDQRGGFVLGVQSGRPDPRVTFRGMKGDLVWDAYYLRSRGQEIADHRSEWADALGLIAIARYHFGSRDEWYVDAGFGIQVQNHTSVDLDTYLNTTPTLGMGYTFTSGGTDWQLSFRFLHISNGGTNLPNQGQNHLQILLGARF